MKRAKAAKLSDASSHAAVAEQLEPAGEEELHQPVRRVPLAPHQRERDGGASVARGEVQEAANVSVRVPAQNHEAVGVVFAPELVE